MEVLEKVLGDDINKLGEKIKQLLGEACTHFEKNRGGSRSDWVYYVDSYGTDNITKIAVSILVGTKCFIPRDWCGLYFSDHVQYGNGFFPSEKGQKLYKLLENK